MASIAHTNATSATLARFDYTYNPLGWLGTETHHGDSTTYQYDSTGQLLLSDRAIGTDEDFAYDANGNRTDDGLLVGPDNQLAADGRFNYVYDGEGNLVSKTSISTGEWTAFTYDHRNRLTEVVARAADGTLLIDIAYRYDALDRRIASTVNGLRTAIAYDGQNAWTDYDANGNAISRYLFGDAADEILARSRPGEGVVWHLADRLGTVHDLVSAAGQVVNHVTYGAFGAVLAETNPAAADRFKFTGREWDGVTGLYYYRARYFDPETARFISEDPIGFDAGDSNLYRYVGNSPANGTDPTGQFLERAVLSIVQNTARAALAGIVVGAGLGGAIAAREGQNWEGIITSGVAGALLGGAIGLAASQLVLGNSAALLALDGLGYSFAYTFGTTQTGNERVNQAVVSVFLFGIPIVYARFVDSSKGANQPSGFGDLTQGEVNAIRAGVDRAGRPLEVVGSSARGGRGPGSDIDYLTPPGSIPYFQGSEHLLPGIDPTHGIVPGVHNPNMGPAIRFEPNSPPRFIPATS